MSVSGIQRIAKPALISMSVLIGACGGGGGSSNPDPDGTISQPQVISPLTEQACSGSASYVWINDQCTLEGYESVTHLEAIEQLPEQDREDLLTWIKSIDKKLDFDAVFPNWESGSPFNEDEEEEATYIDDKLLRVALNDRSIIEDGENYYVLGGVDLFSGTRTLRQESSLLTSTNNSDLYKSAKVYQDGHVGTIFVYDLEVYRFNLVENIRIAGHFGRQALSIDDESTVELDIGVQQANGDFDAEPIMQSYDQYYKAADDSLQAVAAYLQIPDEYIDTLFESVDNVKPFSYKTDIATGESSYFNHRYKNEYAPKMPLQQFFNGGVKNISVTGYFKAADLNNIGITSPDHVLSFKSLLQLTVTEDNAEALKYILSDKKVTFDLYNTVAHSTDLALTSLLQRDELIKGTPYFQTLTAIVQAHSPSFNQLVELVEEFVELEDRSIAQAMMNNIETKQLFLKKASPHYNRDQIPSNDDLIALGKWPQNLGEFLSTQIGDSIDDSALSSLAETIPSEELITIEFYENINNDFEEILRPISADNYPVYAKEVLYTLVKRLYYNRSIADMSVDFGAAIASAGEPFSSVLLAEIRALGNMTKQFNGSQWISNVVAEDNIARTVNLLTPANKANLIEHDGLVASYDISAVIAQLYSLTELRLQGLANKVTALKNIKTFATDDRKIMSSEDDFENGIKQLANVAYAQEWSMDIYIRLDAVMSFNYKRGNYSDQPYCVTDSLAERYRCLNAFSSGHKNRLSTEAQVGYLADYSPEQNPYVEFATKLVDARKTTAELSVANFTRFLTLDTSLDNEIAKGIWITCSATQVRANIDFYVNLSNDLIADISADPNPAYYSDAYTRQDDIKNLLLGSFKSCNNS